MNKALLIEISGRVQGVTFRHFAKMQADKLGLHGYTKNLKNGNLKIFVEGKENALKDFLAWSTRGPLFASVEAIQIKWQTYTGRYANQDEFTIKRSENSFIKDNIKALKNLGKNIITLDSHVNLPNHIALICDGNRRWAKSKGLPTYYGHKKGFDQLVKLSRNSRELGIQYLTLWMFSTENWKRDKQEVDYLMNLFRRKFVSFRKEFATNQVRFRHLGRKDRLPKDIVKTLQEMEEETKEHTKYFLNIALDYGGRDEILRALKKASKLGKNIQSISDEEFSSLLDTAGIPDPDLIIRTSGEQRLSGLLSWQSAYAEFYFPHVLLPDFTEDELKLAILDYSNRTRRYGGNEQTKLNMKG